MGQYLLYLIIVLVIIVALFFLLRELICWYWKINERISQQETIISLLHQLVSNKNVSVNTINELSGKEKKDDDPNLFSEEDKKVISNLRNTNRKAGEHIIINKITRNIKKISNDEWILKYRKDDLWEIIPESE